MENRLDILSKPIVNIEAPSSSALISEAKQDVIPKLAQIVVGQQLRGEILSKLQDGSYTVRVADITAKMMLPEGSKAGDFIPLRLISTDPRPTFLLDKSGKYPQNTTSSTLDETSAKPISEEESQSGLNTASRLQQATNKSSQGLLARSDADVYVRLSENAQKTNNPGGLQTSSKETNSLNATKSTDKIAPTISGNHTNPQTSTLPSSTPTVLSNAGKLIDQILQANQQHGSAPSIVSRTPILSAPVEIKDTAHMAQQLEANISKSGLFYESHVAEWTQGARPLSDILAEPQSKALPTVTVAGDQNATALINNKELTNLIHQQLNTLEQQAVRWQGELFPGQKLDWEISRKKSSDRSKITTTEEPTWQSSVRFDLPHLGQVSAVLHLQSDQVRMVLHTDNPETVATLKTGVTELASALQLSGSTLQSLTVKQND